MPEVLCGAGETSQESDGYMALEHLMPGQSQALWPGAPMPAEFESRALFKSRDLTVIRLLMPEGRRMLEHLVEGDITLHCVRGSVEVGSRARDTGQARPSTRLAEGELLYLQGGESHDLLALAPSVVILTIALRGD